MNSLVRIAIFGLLGTTISMAADQPAAGKQVGQTFTTATQRLDYALFLPQGHGTPDRKWPLIVFLHGAGECGPGLDKVKVHGPPKLVENQPQDFPFVVVSPQAPALPWSFGAPDLDEATKKERHEYIVSHWSRQPLLALLDDVAARYNIDTEQVYLTGLSMGGYGSWHYASIAPERFAATAIICGGGNTAWAPALKSMPLRAYHGNRDFVVPLKESVEMVQAIEAAGGKPTLITYYGVGHDSWTEAYANPELYQWFLSHRRSAAVAKP